MADTQAEIDKLNKEHEKKIEELEGKKILDKSGFKVGQTLSSSLDGDGEFVITGATKAGLTGIQTRPHVVSKAEMSNWQVKAEKKPAKKKAAKKD